MEMRAPTYCQAVILASREAASRGPVRM